MAKKSIVLVGLPGAGKTTVGRNLARNQQLEFLDTDQIIESRIGSSIREYFEQNGEEAFRQLEASTIEGLTGKSGSVISTGGGAILREENRRRLKDSFDCVYLRATPEDLFRRLRHDKKRPLLQVSDPLQTIRDLYVIRDPLYLEVAKVVIDTGRPSVGALVESITEALGLRTNGH